MQLLTVPILAGWSGKRRIRPLICWIGLRMRYRSRSANSSSGLNREKKPQHHLGLAVEQGSEVYGHEFSQRTILLQTRPLSPAPINASAIRRSSRWSVMNWEPGRR